MRFLMIYSLCLLFLSACGDNAGKSRKPSVKLVESYQVKAIPLQLEQTVSSTLQANSRISISNQEPGQLINLPYFPGDIVEKDTVLGKIDDQLLQKELEKALAAEKLAQLDMKRLSRLKKRQLTSEDELARANSTLAQAKAESALLQTRVAQTKLLAPFSGVITQRLHEPGDVLPKHTQVLELMDISSLKAEVNISEILINSLNEEMTVKLRIDALGSKQFDASITRIYPAIDPETHQGSFEFKLFPVPKGARPGQLARLTLTYRTQPRIAVPLRSLQRDTEGEFVYVINEQNKAMKQRIITGLLTRQYAEVLSGIEAGQQVITRGFIDLRHNQLVKTPKPNNKKIN